MASGEDTTRLLSRVPLFADLSERELTELAQVAVPRSWLAGEVIFREGDARLARQPYQAGGGRVAGALPGRVRALPAGSGGEPPREILIRATQAQIAQLSGASRDSASRFLAKLERAGVITTGRGKILVHEPASLNNYIY